MHLVPAFLVAVLTLAPVPDSARASAGKGSARTTVSVRGKTTEINSGRGKSRLAARLTSPGAVCPAGLQAAVIAREVAAHRSAFRSRNVNVEIAQSPAATATFERGVAQVLSAGRSRTRGRHFGALEVKLGRLPRAGASKTVGRSTTVTGLRGGGWTVVSTRRLRGGVVETVRATFTADRKTTSVERTVSAAMRGGGTVAISLGRNGFGVHGQGGPMGPGVGASGGLMDSDQSSGGGGSSSGGESPSGGESGDDGEQENGNSQSQGVGLSSDGTFSAPGLTVPNTAVAEAINWNRLGGAVGRPSPIEDGESGPAGGSATGACGALSDPGFKPDVKYLEPNPKGRVSDPVPFLRK